MRPEDLASLNMKISAICDVTQCSLLVRYHASQEAVGLHVITFYKNIIFSYHTVPYEQMNRHYET